MRFHFKSTPTIQIFLWITLAISLVGFIIGILVLTGVHIEVTHAQGVLLVSVFSLTLVVCVLLETIHYKVDSQYIHLNIAFIDMLSNRIRIDHIMNIVIEKNIFYISYEWKGPDPVIASIMINPKHFDKLKNYLMSLNDNIVLYESKDDETSDSK